MIKPIYLLALMGTIGLAFTTKPVQGDFDLPGLNQQVQNHEARITNNENDIKALQENTNTAPAPNPTPVPAVTAQPVAETPLTSPEPPTASPVVEGDNHVKSSTCVYPNGQPCRP